MSSIYAQFALSFERDHVLYWSNLSRVNNVLVIMNISMFFLTGLVAKGYYYTFYSLACSVVVAVASLVPASMVRKPGYYMVWLIVEFVGLYYLISSAVYWVRNGSA